MKLITQRSRLASLDLCYNGLRDNGASQIANALRSLQNSLNKIDLSFNKIGAQGHKKIWLAIQARRQLHVNLNGNENMSSFLRRAQTSGRIRYPPGLSNLASRQTAVAAASAAATVLSSGAQSRSLHTPTSSPALSSSPGSPSVFARLLGPMQSKPSSSPSLGLWRFLSAIPWQSSAPLSPGPSTPPPSRFSRHLAAWTQSRPPSDQRFDCASLMDDMHL